MGSRLAMRLLDASYRVGVFDRDVTKTRSLVEKGARAYDSVQALAGAVDVLLTSLADDAAVEQVLLGQGGALQTMRPNAVLVDLSSVYPGTSRAIESAARVHGVKMLDAPVSGSTPQAADGSLVLFVGGDRSAYDGCRQVLDVLSSNSFFMGASGSGSTMKLVANALLGAQMPVLGEAIALGLRAGLDRDVLLETLGATTVLTPGQKSKLENVRAGTYPVTFALRLMWKDFGNILRLAQECTVPMPITAAAHQVFAVEQARGVEEDFSAVIRTMVELGQL
jgi:3-hydroxyisobutyrate dehydrogenase